MKKLSILLIAILAVSFSSCRSTDKRILKNEADSLAYVIGMNVGYNLKYNTDSTLNVEALCAAIRDIYADKTLMDMDEAGAFYRQYYNVVKPRRAREASQRFLEETLRDTLGQEDRQRIDLCDRGAGRYGTCAATVGPHPDQVSRYDKGWPRNRIDGGRR